MGYRKSCAHGNNPPLILRCERPYPMKKLIEANPRVCPRKLSATEILAWLIVVPRFIHPKLIYPTAKMLVLFLVKYVHRERINESGFIYKHRLPVSCRVSEPYQCTRKAKQMLRDWSCMGLVCDKILGIIVNAKCVHIGLKLVWNLFDQLTDVHTVPTSEGAAINSERVHAKEECIRKLESKNCSIFFSI